MSKMPTPKMPSEKEIERGIARSRRQQTPGKGNRCKRFFCRGRIVQRVSGQYGYGLTYGPPTCEKCSRIYRLAENVPKVGKKEWREMMEEPFTI